MALDNARQLLDELMGRARNEDPLNKDVNKFDWQDERVCRLHLVKFCPNQLFTNTKADLGNCNKVHDDVARESFKKTASKSDRTKYEDEFLHLAQEILADVDKKIKRARQRLAAHQNKDDDVPNAPVDDLQERINSLSKKIDQFLEEIEIKGSEGRVDEAQESMKELDKLKDERSSLYKEKQASTHWIQLRAEMGAQQEKSMEVCDVCGAFLVVGDVQQRVDDHLSGKQHVGFGKLKAAVDDLLKSRRSERSERNGHCHHRRPSSRERSPQRRSHSRSSSRNRHHSKSNNKRSRSPSSPSDYRSRRNRR